MEYETKKYLVKVKHIVDNVVELLEKNLEELKTQAAMKDLEYIKKQKEIAMYLEYKKTFIGKIKLFLKFKKKDNKATAKNNNDNQEDAENKVEKTEVQTLNKEYYTIEDLVTIYASLDKQTAHTKDLKADIKALELKIKNLTSKIDNATKYIEEIEKVKGK